MGAIRQGLPVRRSVGRCPDDCRRAAVALGACRPVFGTVGAVSVFKAVYIDKRELKCACVGGDSSVPLGFISLTENLMMIFMGIWMPVRAIWF